MTVIEEELGLRERKRRATRLGIQRAAIELATERGVDKVTVEEISHAANVSSRTFFNYFPSKDAAIVGELPSLPDEAAVERFVTAGERQTILAGVEELLTNSMLADEPSADEAENATGSFEAELHDRRRALLKDHPQLVVLKMASMREFENELSEVLQRRLANDDPALAADAEALRQRARLVTYLAFAGMRHAWSCWADRGGRDSLSARLHESFEQIQSFGASTR